jgi:hypothetical protein
VNSVLIGPGSITTTLTPKPRTSKRSASLIASIAYFDAAYAPAPGIVTRPATELMFTIRPAPLRRMPGSTSWAMRK